MKIIPCSCPTCSDRRIHHDDPYTKRPHQMVEVPDDYNTKYVYCSIECSMYDKRRREEEIGSMADPEAAE